MKIRVNYNSGQTKTEDVNGVSIEDVFGKIFRYYTEMDVRFVELEGDDNGFRLAVMPGCAQGLVQFYGGADYKKFLDQK